MRLAWRELRRQPSRFAIAAAILSLIAILLMFLGGLLDGLVGDATGPLQAQRADLVVYSAKSEDTLGRSRIGSATRSQVERSAGPAAVGGLGTVSLGARLDGRGPRDLVSISLYGYELAPQGLPVVPPATGEVIADDSLRAEGIRAGDTIWLGPDRTPVTVIGFDGTDTSYGSGTVWGSLRTWRQVLAANQPGLPFGADDTQALVIRLDPTQTGDLAASIDAATGGDTHTLSIAAAADAIPGVQAQRSTFNQIIGVTVAIAIVVVALFFALLTVERTGRYGVLKAIGAGTGTLFAGVALQAVLVTVVASIIGVATTLMFGALIPPGSIPFRIRPTRLAGSVAVLLVAAVVGSAFSLRRVLRIDPAAAIGGTQ
ncbi:FtsX-like permease family protein [Microlunatus panaciterrae]|uniref:ABC transport system permease protein n=1 Tax=Microlunatus panaciterrae TaxID=400768 RepID=A0ABS2RIF5_9ACTN|nr:ABC transporter permease [Microlunatus panaciterrae]MBM7798770.1 putative ABC transport system permease protein [Microlunatus panaciterrae]